MNTRLLLICFFILLLSHSLLCTSTSIPEAGSPILLQGEQFKNGSNEMIGKKGEDGKKEIKHVRRAKGGTGDHGGGSNTARHPKDKNGAPASLAESSLTVLQLSICFLFFF